jgi:hypothetical protein
MKTHKVILPLVPDKHSFFHVTAKEAKYYKEQGYTVVKLLKPIIV